MPAKKEWKCRGSPGPLSGWPRTDSDASLIGLGKHPRGGCLWSRAAKLSFLVRQVFSGLTNHGRSPGAVAYCDSWNVMRQRRPPGLNQPPSKCSPILPFLGGSLILQAPECATSNHDGKQQTQLMQKEAIWAVQFSLGSRDSFKLSR